MPLHPVIEAIFAQFAAAGRPAISAGDPAAARALMSSAREALGPGPALPRVETLDIPTRSGTIPGRLFVPGPAPEGLVVYLHGGGWVIGGIDDFDGVARLFAKESGCALLLPDYRLAPEFPHPAPLEDCLDSVLWAAAHAERLAGAAVPLALAGDSAGGNLAAVVAATLRGQVALTGQVLIYPVTDCDFETPSYLDKQNAGLLTRADMIWFFDHYAPGAARTDPTVSPLRLADLDGLPPAHVATAEYDVLRDEGEAYAARLEAAGIPVTLKRYEGLPHGFIRLFNLVDAVASADREIAQAIRDACRGRAERPAAKARASVSA